jgi:hypothetical protein
LLPSFFQFPITRGEDLVLSAKQLVVRRLREAIRHDGSMAAGD